MTSPPTQPLTDEQLAADQAFADSTGILSAARVAALIAEVRRLRAFRKVYHEAEQRREALVERCARAEGALVTMREALEDLLFMFSRTDENANDKLERLATLFYSETGILHPAKDEAAAVGDHGLDRRAKYNEWFDAKVSAARSALSSSSDYAGKVVVDRTKLDFIHLVMSRALSTYPSLELIAGFTETLARLDSLRKGGQE